MDAQTRHNLKQNELAEALFSLRDAWKNPRARQWTLLILLAVLVFVAVRVWRWSSRNAVHGGWAQLNSVLGEAKEPAEAIAGLKGMIDRGATPPQLATARLLLAHMLLEEGAKDVAKLKPNAEEAVDVLKLVTTADVPAQYVSTASFKLATAYETLGRFDDARAAYEHLSSEPQFAGTGYVDLAKRRFETMDAVASVPQFLSGSPPPPASAPTMTEVQPSVAPEIQISPGAAPAPPDAPSTPPNEVVPASAPSGEVVPPAEVPPPPSTP